MGLCELGGLTGGGGGNSPSPSWVSPTSLWHVGPDTLVTPSLGRSWKDALNRGGGLGVVRLAPHYPWHHAWACAHSQPSRPQASPTNARLPVCVQHELDMAATPGPLLCVIACVLAAAIPVVTGHCRRGRREVGQALAWGPLKKVQWLETLSLSPGA